MSPNPTVSQQRSQPLTDHDARHAQPKADGSTNILRFGGGLDLWVGRRSKTWRCKVQRDRKSTTLTLGQYPVMTLRQARAKRAALLDRNVDPIAERLARRSVIRNRAAADEKLIAAFQQWMAAR